MMTYVLLMNLTEQGIKSIKDAPKRVDAMSKVIEKAGGKLTGFYSVLGEYDYVAIAEVPTEEVGVSLLLTLGMLGNVRTKTMRAFTKPEFTKIVKKLP
jgi:uncharacterized protein with GYD domain